MEWVIKSRREDLHSRVRHGGHEILRSLRVCGKHFSNGKYNNDSRFNMFYII